METAVAVTGAMTRKPLSKRTRFEIFKRDGFKCFYCGATPTDSPMHVDHVQAVANGGTNEPHNLITACQSCNGGKSSVPLEQRRYQGKATEADREHLEQLKEFMAIQREMVDAKSEIADEALSHWERICGEVPHALPARIVRMVSEFGLSKLVEAFERVESKRIYNSTEKLKYLHGVLKGMRKDSLPLPTKQNSSAGVTDDPRVTPCQAAVENAEQMNVGRNLTERQQYEIICREFLKAAKSKHSIWWLNDMPTWGHLAVGPVALTFKKNGRAEVVLSSSFNSYEDAYANLSYRIDQLSLDCSYFKSFGTKEDGTQFNLEKELGETLNRHHRIKDWMEYPEGPCPGEED